ncbi:MAG: S9 family peptidase [Deltaproteobacteria bacterium]|nr:S9 family peptidase [Deltaproteobacteria bacterium]
MKIPWKFSLIILTGFIFFVTGCSISPVHPTLVKSDLPELIPLRDFFLNVDTKYAYSISPDGNKISWLEPKSRRLTIYFKTIGKEDTQTIDTHSPRNIYGVAWLQNSRHMLFHLDQDGDENHHIYIVDTEQPDGKPVDITPFKGTKGRIHQVLKFDPNQILIQHNQRNKKIFDLYSVNIETKKQTLIAENPGNVSSWITDVEGTLRGRVLKNKSRDPDEYWIFEIQTSENDWAPVISWNLDEDVSILGFTPDNNGVWLLSNKSRDRKSLIRLNLNTKKETLLYEDPQVDIRHVLISEITKKPLVVVFHTEYQNLHFFDKDLEKDITSLKQGNTGIGFSGVDYSERVLALSVFTDKSVDFYIYNRNTKTKELQSSLPISEYEDQLSTVQPISFKARDGLTIPGYLTIPKGTSGKNLPMVLLVHGGPWSRDYWGYNRMVQFLANRGYVVLQINYRGSRGYGRTFMEAAIGEFAGKMHDDLIDGVKWVVDRGIVDPDKICIFGGSYGGYATLVGLTFTPDTFTCGIDLVGISNLVTFVESVPDSWDLYMGLWHKYVGNPKDPDDRKNMEAKSPLFRVDKIKKPLLIGQGANDPRVTQKESDQIVEAMEKAGKKVEYMLFPNEGHGLRNWQNKLRFNRKVEDFLSEHLGGRNAGFDYYELGLLIF